MYQDSLKYLRTTLLFSRSVFKVCVKSTCAAEKFSLKREQMEIKGQAGDICFGGHHIKVLPLEIRITGGVV